MKSKIIFAKQKKEQKMRVQTTFLFSLLLSSLQLQFHRSNSTHVIKSRSSDWSDDDSDYYDIDLASSRCHPNPCENNGVCHDTDEGITCTCAHGYLGHRCQGKKSIFIFSIYSIRNFNSRKEGRILVIIHDN